MKNKFKNVGMEFNSKEIIAPYELDIYIPKYKFGLEANGEYWHCNVHREVNYHQQKSLMCLERGIQLYHFFEGEDPIKASDDICSIIFRRYSLLPDEVIVDFARDNGARLVKHGYELVNITSPQLFRRTKYGDIYDAGKATFRKKDT